MKVLATIIFTIFLCPVARTQTDLCSRALPLAPEHRPLEFRHCNDSEITSIEEDYDQALAQTEMMNRYIQWSNEKDAIIVSHLGKMGPLRYNRLKRQMGKLGKKMKTSRIKFKCTQQTGDVLAENNPGGPRNVIVHKTHFLSSKETRVATIFHELTHEFLAKFDHAYPHDAKFSRLSNWQKFSNAASFEELFRQFDPGK